MTFVECEGTGQYIDHEKEHISANYQFADAYRMIKLELLVADEHVYLVIDLIRKNGRTGFRGDGMITGLEWHASIYLISYQQKELLILRR